MTEADKLEASLKEQLRQLYERYSLEAQPILAKLVELESLKKPSALHLQTFGRIMRPLPNEIAASFRAAFPDYVKGEPQIMCEHCGRYAAEAEQIGSTRCNPPFTARLHEWTRKHPYLTY